MCGVCGVLVWLPWSVSDSVPPVTFLACQRSLTANMNPKNNGIHVQVILPSVHVCDFVLTRMTHKKER